MKNIELTLLFCCFACIGMQAKKVVKAPYFMAANTGSIEIEKVTLGKDTTWLDVKIYNMPGEGVRIDSTAMLEVIGKGYAYIGSEGFSKGLWTKIPASGELAATLKFEPIPMDAESFDFFEMPKDKDKGWSIYGVRLDGKKPAVTIPDNLLNRQPDYSTPLPEPKLKNGKSVVRGQLLGYNPQFGVDVNINTFDWFFSDFFGKTVPVQPDGSFSYETNLLLPTLVTLRLGGSRYNLFMVPDGELKVTFNLLEVYWSRTHLFGKKEKECTIWFEGTYAGLNTELVKYGKLMSISATDDFYDKICGMDPLQYKKLVNQIYKENRAAIGSNKTMSEACRTYLTLRLDMGYFSAIKGFKTSIAYAPMISGKKGVKRADLTVDDHYFDEILQLDFPRSPYLILGTYTDFVRVATTDFKGKFESIQPLWDDIYRAKPLGTSLSKLKPLTKEQLLTVDSISTPEIKEVLLIKNEEILAQLAEVASKTGYRICELDTAVKADSLLQMITRPYRGKVVLIDMWNTWCGPCMRAMKSLLPVKAEFKDVVYIYIADESSPEGKWKVTIPDIHGIHYRITSEQGSALAKKYNYPGIPTYFIIGKDGNIVYQTTGFPGAEKMKEEIGKLVMRE